jgi:drug/metabolite transporter (DMT)-like permease
VSAASDTSSTTTSNAVASRTVTLAMLGAAGAAVCWGINGGLLKVLSAQVPIPVLNTSRLLFAAMMLLGIVAVTRTKTNPWPKLEPKIWLQVAVVGFVGTSIYQLMYATGIHLTGAGMSSLTSSTNPVWVGLLSAMLGERLTRRQGFGVLLSVSGVIALSLKSFDPVNRMDPMGVLMLVGANIAWAIYTVAAKPLFKHMAALEFTAFSLGLGCLPYVLWNASSLLGPAVQSIRLETWALMALSALIAQVLGFLGWFNAARVLGANRVSVFANLMPIVGVTVGVMLLNEPFGWLDAVSAVVILAGVYLANSK